MSGTRFVGFYDNQAGATEAVASVPGGASVTSEEHTIPSSDVVHVHVVSHGYNPLLVTLNKTEADAHVVKLRKDDDLEAGDNGFYSVSTYPVNQVVANSV